MTRPNNLARLHEAPLHADEQLKRIIGPWGLGAAAVNSAIGAGIFVLPGVVAAILGPAAILAYFICGLIVALVLTCYIEVGSIVHRSGGGVAYVEAAFGPLMGFLAWVMYSVGFEVVASAALGTVLVDSVAPVLPPLAHGVPRAVALFVLFGGLAAVNIAGVRQGLRIAVVTTIAKLFPLLFAVLAGVFFMHWHEFHWTGWPPFAKLGDASLLLFFAFQGIEEALGPSAEIRDPERTVPHAMFGATGSIIILYVALQLVSQGILGADLAHQATAPLAAVAGRIIGVAGRTLILTGVAVSIFGSLATSMLAAPRAFFLAAEDRLLPGIMAKVHPRYRTPYIAILTVAALMFLLAVSGEFKPLAVLSSGSILCVYLAICLGALKLRYTRKREPGAFRAPGGPVVGILGSIAVIWLLSHSTRMAVEALGATLALAIAYFTARRWFLKRQPAETN